MFYKLISPFFLYELEMKSKYVGTFYVADLIVSDVQIVEYFRSGIPHYLFGMIINILKGFLWCGLKLN